MRFAWLRQKAGRDEPITESLTSKIITIIYNVAWWLPLVLALTRAVDYRTGSILMFAITMFRAVANAYRINVLRGEKAEGFPLRAP